MVAKRIARISLFLIFSLPAFMEAQEMITSSSSRLPAKTLHFADRWSFGAGGGPSKYMSDLFSLDSSVSKYPEHVNGTIFFAGTSYQVSRSFTLSARFFRNDVLGKGTWMRNSGDPRGQGVDATANGPTRILQSGFAILGQERFFSRWRVQPFVEGGVGLNTAFRLDFHGTASGIDGDGDSFSLPASDKIARREWTPIAGAGIVYPIRPGVDFQSGYEWSGMSYGPIASINLYPFKLISKKK